MADALFALLFLGFVLFSWGLIALCERLWGGNQ